MKKIVYGIFAAVAVLLTLFVLSLMVTGTKAYAVTTDSMAMEFLTNAAVFVRPVDFEKLQAGDVVTFTLSDGSLVTHRIIEIDGENRRIYTKGDNSPSPDPEPTDADQIVGRMLFSLPYFGFLANKIASDRMTVIYILAALAAVLLTVRVIMQNRKKA